MRRLLLLSCLVLACAPALAQKLRIEAGEVVSPAAATAGIRVPISGTFKLIEDKDGIVSASLGGGCLVGDFSERGLGAATCARDQDCNPRDGFDARFAEAMGYCVEQRCWVRPGPAAAYCLRSIDQVEGRMRGALVTGRTYTLPVAEADVFGDGQPTTWRVHTCLNPMQTTGCASLTDDTELTANGPPKRVP
jgi:hypothetical protein